MKSSGYRESKPKPAAKRPSRSLGMGEMLRSLSLMVTGSAVLAGMVLGYGIWRSGDRFLSNVWSLFTAPQPEPVVNIQSIMLQQVRSASELTTAVFAMQAVVPTSRDRTVGGYTIGKTTLLYIAYGEVRAGVDLSKLQPEDLRIQDNLIYLRLPPPQILDSKIDVTRSRVYDYDRGFLSLGPDVAPDLQSLAQEATLQQIVQTACSEGLLEQANDRAKAALTQLLGTTPSNPELIIETQPPTPSACFLPSTTSNVFPQ